MLRVATSYFIVYVTSSTHRHPVLYSKSCEGIHSWACSAEFHYCLGDVKYKLDKRLAPCLLK